MMMSCRVIVLPHVSIILEAQSTTKGWVFFCLLIMHNIRIMLQLHDVRFTFQACPLFPKEF